MPHQQSNPVDNDGYDPNKAFEQRRQMYLNVQEIQRLEHEAINRISKAMVSKKTELLEILSAWLMSQNGYRPEHNEVESMTGCDMPEWIILQQKAAPLEAEANRTRWEAEDASRQYKEAAPLGHVGMGFVNELIADAEKKNRIAALSAVSQTKNAARDEAARCLASNVEQRQRFGKRFLRACLENIQYLEASSVFGSRADTLISEMTHTLEKEWQDHRASTMAAMGSLVGNLKELHGLYSIKGE